MHFTQSCSTLIGGCYLKASRTTAMVSGKDDFLYRDDLKAVLAIIDAFMFENDEDMESETVTFIKNLPSTENCSFKSSFVQKVVYPKQVSQGIRKQNINSTLTMIVSAIVILALQDEDWNLLISV